MTLTNTTGTITFTGALNATTLNTAANGYSVALNAGGTVSGAVVTTFSNTGTVTLGNDAADVLAFEAGLIATAPTTRNLAGTISALDAAALINLGGANAINVTANTTLGGAATGAITLGAAVVLPDAVTLILGAGAASAVSTQAISGTAAGAVSNLTINSTAAVTINGAVGTDIGTVTVTNSGGTTFSAALTATTVTLTNTTGTITFTGALNATTLNTAANGYSVTLNGGGTVTNAVTFSNTGSLTIDPSGFTFTGGAQKTVAGAKSFEGPISSTNAALNFGTAGAVTLTGNTTFSSGTGAITLFDLTAANFNLVLQGSGADVLGIVNLGTGTLNLAGKTGGSVTVNGLLNAGALTTIGNGYSVALNAGGTVSGAVATTFSNTGTVTLGNDAGDVLAFEAGLIATAPTTRNLAGTISALDAAALINLGGANAINVTANTTLGGAGTGAITLGAAVVLPDAVTLILGAGAASAVSTQAISGTAAGAVSNLTINSTAAVTINGAVGTDIGTVTVTNSGGTTFSAAVTAATVTLTNTTGTITFTNNLTVSGNLSAGAFLFGINFNSAPLGQTTTVGGTADMLNTGTVSFGNDPADIFSAAGGLTHSAGPSIVVGSVSTTNTPLTLGSLTVTSTTSLFSGTGALTLGNIIINDGVTLTLGTGVATAIITGSISGVLGGATSSVTFNTTGVVSVGAAVGTDIGTVTVTNSGGATFSGNVTAATVTLTNTTGTVTFTGALTATTLNTAAAAYSVALNGGGTITNAVTFSNSGSVTLGNDAADVLAFTAGVVATAPTTRNLAGTITAAGAADLNFSGANPVNVTATTLLGGATTGTIWLTVAVTLPDGVTLTLGSGGSATTIVTAAISGTAGGAVSDIVINTTAAANIGGVVGTDIGTVTVTNSSNTIFTSTVAATTVTLTASTGTITFSGTLTATTLTVAGGVTNVALNAGGTISGAVATTFSNTGTLTLGDDAGDALAFEAGVAATVPATRSLAGTISALDALAVINLGGANAINVTANTTLGGAGTGAITLGVAVVLPDAVTLTLGAGAASAVSTQAISGTAAGAVSNLTINSTAAVTIGGAVGTDIGTVTVANSGGITFNGAVTAGTVNLIATTGSITFNQNLTVTTLITVGNAYNVALNGTGSFITADTAFLNTGTVTLGNGALDITQFTNGVRTTGSATNPSATIIGGRLLTANAHIDLGAVTLSSPAIIDSTNGGAGAGATINIASVTSLGSSLNLLSHTGATMVSGNVVGVGALTLQQNNALATGAMSFDGSVSATSITTFLQNYKVSLNGGGTISTVGATTFNNLGTLTLRRRCSRHPHVRGQRGGHRPRHPRHRRHHLRGERRRGGQPRRRQPHQRDRHDPAGRHGHRGHHPRGRRDAARRRIADAGSGIRLVEHAGHHRHARSRGREPDHQRHRRGQHHRGGGSEHRHRHPHEQLERHIRQHRDRDDRDAGRRHGYGHVLEHPDGDHADGGSRCRQRHAERRRDRHQRGELPQHRHPDHRRERVRIQRRRLQARRRQELRGPHQLHQRGAGLRHGGRHHADGQHHLQLGHGGDNAVRPVSTAEPQPGPPGIGVRRADGCGPWHGNPEPHGQDGRFGDGERRAHRAIADDDRQCLRRRAERRGHDHQRGHLLQLRIGDARQRRARRLRLRRCPHRDCARLEAGRGDDHHIKRQCEPGHYRHDLHPGRDDQPGHGLHHARRSHDHRGLDADAGRGSRDPDHHGGGERRPRSREPGDQHFRRRGDNRRGRPEHRRDHRDQQRRDDVLRGGDGGFRDPVGDDRNGHLQRRTDVERQSQRRSGRFRHRLQRQCRRPGLHRHRIGRTAEHRHGNFRQQRGGHLLRCTRPVPRGRREHGLRHR